MKVYMMMFCVGITKIDMEKTFKRDIHQKIFDEMDEMFEVFGN